MNKYLNYEVAVLLMRNLAVKKDDRLRYQKEINEIESVEYLSLEDRQNIIEKLNFDFSQIKNYIKELYYVASRIEEKYLEDYLNVLTASYYILDDVVLFEKVKRFYLEYMEKILLKKFRDKR